MERWDAFFTSTAFLLVKVFLFQVIAHVSSKKNVTHVQEDTAYRINLGLSLSMLSIPITFVRYLKASVIICVIHT